MQGLVQFISALSGFLLVRLLSKRELAAYTIAMSMQTILNVLTDSGIGTGLNAIGGRVWRVRDSLSKLVSTAFEYRAQLAYFAVPAGVFFSLWLFRKNDFPWLIAVALTLLVVATLWWMWMVSVYSTPLRLHGRYWDIQRSELFAAVLRLFALGLMAFIFLNTLVAVAVTLVSILFQAILIRKMVATVIDRDAPRDPSYHAELTHLVKKQFFQVLYFAFQGQITICLISYFGSVEKLADLGALGRISIPFAVVGSVVINLISPTFARCDSLPRLRRLTLLALGAYSSFGGALMLAAWQFPNQLLWLIGPNYSGLTRELPIMMAGAVLSGLTGIIHALAFARAWLWHVWLIPIVTVGLQIFILSRMDLGTVRGVLIFGLLSALPNLLGVIYMATRGFWQSWKCGRIYAHAVENGLSDAMPPP